MYIWNEEIDLNVHDSMLSRYVTTDMSMYKGAVDCIACKYICFLATRTMTLKGKRPQKREMTPYFGIHGVYMYVQGQKIMMIKIQLPYFGPRRKGERVRIEDVKNAGHQGSVPYIVIWKSCRKFQFYKIAHQHLSFAGSFAVMSLMIRVEKYVQTTE